MASWNNDPSGIVLPTNGNPYKKGAPRIQQYALLGPHINNAFCSTRCTLFVHFESSTSPLLSRIK